MARNRNLIFVLSLLLLFAQQGAVVHAVSHIPDVAQQEQKLPHTQFCDQCIAYAQVGDGARSERPIFASPNEHAAADSATVTFFLSLAILAFSSRAPPTVL